jgi:hypothetical protein
MFIQNFRASAQSALISAIMAVSAFALVIGPDPVRYAAVAALLVLLPVALLAIRMGTVAPPPFDPASLTRLELSSAPKVDQILIAAAWLGLAGACVTGLAALERFAVPGVSLRIAGFAGAALTTLAATPVIAALVRPMPIAELGPAGVRLSPTRLIRWKDMDAARCMTLGPNRLSLVLKPSPRDPGGPPQKVKVLLAPVMEPWMGAAASAIIARNLTAAETNQLEQPAAKPKPRKRPRALPQIEDKRFQAELP